MGAAATVETSRASEAPPNKAKPVIICCEACQTPVGFLKRKKCAICSRLHCGRCLSSHETQFSGRMACKKCHTLASGTYSREVLSSQFSTQELREFLVRERVPVSSCKEKNDLIELALQRPQYRQRQQAGSSFIRERQHEEHVAQLTENAAQELRNNASRSISSSSLINTAVSEQTSNSVDPPVIEETPSEDLHQNTHDSSQDEHIQPSADSTDNLSNNDGEQRTSGNGAVVTGESTRHRVTLADIKSRDDIVSLTVRQLKDLLVNNYVDYKGCCEKQELVDRVSMLWTDYEKSRVLTSGSDDQSSQNEVCKICMDSVIDCILLECGHMVACTSCGKRLAECPVCRRYVSRVVHVFRA